MKIRLSELRKVVRDTLREMYGDDAVTQTHRSPDTSRDPEQMLATMWDTDELAPDTEMPETEFGEANLGPSTEIEPSPFTMRSPSSAAQSPREKKSQ